MAPYFQFPAHCNKVDYGYSASLGSVGFSYTMLSDRILNANPSLSTAVCNEDGILLDMGGV